MKVRREKRCNEPPLRAANKGTSVPAEPTEGRAGTKGNPRGQSTHRTQRRARVSQAAERIRQAAPISYRDLETMMTERGVSVDHSTIYRWVQRFAPDIEKRLRWQWRRPRSAELAHRRDLRQEPREVGVSVPRGRQVREHDRFLSLGEARVVECAFGVGPCALTEAMALYRTVWPAHKRKANTLPSLATSPFVKFATEPV